MKVEIFAHKVKKLGINTVTGIPDSTLQQFCDYICKNDIFENHIVTENEGASVGVAIGEYLATGSPACVYMQNSGLGNVVNPVTSLANSDVYGIPMLLIVGWRGEPGTKDEPQHKYMGKITLDLLKVLDIPYAVVDSGTTEDELDGFLEIAGNAFADNKQYALVVKRGAFEKDNNIAYSNNYLMKREQAIEIIVRWLKEDDIIVSTTGKISREMYENCNAILGSHAQTFLTVGGMGHANMIAYQLAQRKTEQRVICLDGDGALLMHMGSLAVLGRKPANNMIHICLNNDAHESVGGMPTGAVGMSYAGIAEKCGYNKVYHVDEEKALQETLAKIRTDHEMAFLEINVAIGSRNDLGRPKETAEENKISFMEYLGDLS